MTASLEEIVATMVRLGQEEVNFDVGERYPAASWKKPERRMRRRMPVSWQLLISEFGAGHISVGRPPSTDVDRDARENDPFQVVGWPAHQRAFDFTILAPEHVEPADDCLSEGRDGWQGWCVVGDEGSGDALWVRCEREQRTRPEDAEFAWYNHEGGELTYKWPGLADLLAHLLDWHDRGQKKVVGDKAQLEFRASEYLRKNNLTEPPPPKPATPNPYGWVKCPHCGVRFLLTDRLSWDGRVHRTCAQRVDLVEPNAMQSG